MRHDNDDDVCVSRLMSLNHYPQFFLRLRYFLNNKSMRQSSTLTVNRLIRISIQLQRPTINKVLAIQQSRAMASSSDANIENTNIKTASGVSLDDTQKTLVGCVLDVSGFYLEPRNPETKGTSSSSPDDHP